MKLLAIVTTALCLVGCVTNSNGVALAPHGVRDFCVDSACTSLENSGAHYQATQQGYIWAP